MQSNKVKNWNLEILAHKFSFEVIFHKKKIIIKKNVKKCQMFWVYNLAELKKLELFCFVTKVDVIKSSYIDKK